jgi:hypothetical protein
MAHENLRFRLDLEDRKEYQPILASQDYGTFYLVYAKITSYEKVEVNGIEKHRYWFDFKLQNFRGCITMGFVDSNEDEHKTFSLGRTKSKNRILYGDFELVVKVAPFRVSSEITQVPLDLNEPLQKGHIIRTNLGRMKPPKELYLSEAPDEARYLNPYRFERDGDEYLEIATRHFGREVPFKEPAAGGVHGGICVPELSLVI